MTELVEYLVKKVVTQPEQVAVTPYTDEYGTVYEVVVAPDDMGKVIGRGGRIINSIRTVVKSVGQRDGVNAIVELVEPEDAPYDDEGAGESDGADRQPAG